MATTASTKRPIVYIAPTPPPQPKREDTSKNLKRKLLTSFMFTKYYSLCINSESTLKGKCWSLRRTIMDCNEILSGFLRSKHKSIDDFFNYFVDKKFGKKKRRALNFVLTLFFSIERYSKTNYEVEIFNLLFSTRLHKSVMSRYLEMKKTALNILGYGRMVIGQFDKDGITNLFMDQSQVEVFGARIEDQWNNEDKVLKKRKRQRADYESFAQRLINWIRKKDAEMRLFRTQARSSDPLVANEAKEKLELLSGLFKVGKTSIAVLLWRILIKYISDDVKEIKEEEEQEELAQKNLQVADDYVPQDSDVIVVGEDGEIIEVDKVNVGARNDEQHKMDMIAMQSKKEALINEIQAMYKAANTKRSTILKMAGLTKALDEITKECKDGVEKKIDNLNKIRVTIKNDELIRLMFLAVGGIEGTRFFKTSQSNLTDDNYSKIEDVSMEERIKFKLIADYQFSSRGYHTQNNRFIALLRQTLKMNPELFKKKKLNRRERDMEDLERMQNGLDFKKMNIRQKKVESRPVLMREEDMSVRMEHKDNIEEIVEDDEAAINRFNELIHNTNLKREEMNADDVGSEDIEMLDDQEIERRVNEAEASKETELLPYDDSVVGGDGTARPGEGGVDDTLVNQTGEDGTGGLGEGEDGVDEGGLAPEIAPELANETGEDGTGGLGEGEGGLGSGYDDTFIAPTDGNDTLGLDNTEVNPEDGNEEEKKEDEDPEKELEGLDAGADAGNEEQKEGEGDQEEKVDEDPQDELAEELA